MNNIYKVKETLVSQGKIFRPGDIIKVVSEEEKKKLKGKIERVKKFTKVITNKFYK